MGKWQGCKTQSHEEFRLQQTDVQCATAFISPKREGERLGIKEQVTKSLFTPRGQHIKGLMVHTVARAQVGERQEAEAMGPRPAKLKLSDKDLEFHSQLFGLQLEEWGYGGF